MPEHVVEFVEGEVLRDWALEQPTSSVFPCSNDIEHIRIPEEPNDPRVRYLWPFRTMLWLRREPNGTHREIGLTWYKFSRFHPERFEDRASPSPSSPAQPLCPGPRGQGVQSKRAHHQAEGGGDGGGAPGAAGVFEQLDGRIHLATGVPGETDDGG